MTSCAGSPATNVAQRLINGAMREVNFLCCFNNHVESFENKKEQLSARRIQVLKSIEDAKERDETQVDDDVQRFLNETDVIIEEDTKTRKKRFHSWCPDCIWQCRQGKKLAKKMQDIEDLIGRSYEFQRVAYHAKIPSFIDFESRKSTFEELVEALENGNYCMIGLQGLWGIGKTTLAHQVGVHVEESKAFQKVIFTTVSNAPDISKIQADIARQLGLSLEERGEAEHSKILWSRIANDSERLLIILDEVWSALNLEDIGIPSGNDHKNCCVLVTTRDVRVCRAMECQLTIHLQTLTNQDALRLFMTHASDDDLSSSDLNGVALDIVNKCGGLPVAIVEIARTLRNRPVGEWKLTLTTLRNSQPSVDIDESLANIHKCLKLSYDNLRNEKAKKLFLLCSLFPEDYEIPISLLIRLGTGAGIFGEVDKYCEARSQALAVKNELIASSLLLEVEKGCVKMPDLVSEVARWIAKEDAQVIMNSKVTLKSNLRFLSWSADEFPNQFHGAKLEVLLLWINGYVKLEDAKAIFKEMGGLRVLVLCCGVENCFRLPLQPFLLLKNIRTFILTGWKLANISILGNMQSLETLELNYCSITELPKEIKELEKLKLLGLRGCSIERNNPFEVIERCSRLEELYFVENTNVEDWEPGSDRNNIDNISQDISPPALRMYSIDCSGLEYFDGDNGLLKCFNTKYVKNLISGAMFQHLLEKAEVLELWGKEETRWRSLVPDIIPIKDGVANDLIKLCLYEWDSIECLIDARELLHSDATVFSKLVELHMRDVGVRELCGGHRMPSRFLEQLQVLKIWRCMKLHSIFLDGSLKLPHLKVLKLEHCALLGSVFKPSDAQSLAQLEELVIEGCNKLRTLIADESSGEEMADVDHQNSYVPMFLRLKTLKINACESLELVWPLLLAGDLPLLQDLSIRSCEQLRYISDECQVLHQQTFLPSLTVIDLYRVPNLIDIFRASSLESRASRKGTEILFTAECLLRPPLGFQNIRRMKLSEFPNIRSLFSVAIAATIMLEELEISYCEELKHIIKNEGDDYNHINNSSIFPKLQGLHISYCNKMEYIFPSTFSGLQKLKYMTIDGAIELKHVFGKYNHEDYSSNDNENGIDLPALEALSLKDVPNLIRICINRYHLKCPSLQNLDAPKATKMRKGAKIFEIEVTPDVGYKYGLNFHNLQQITITRNRRLQTMFSTSTWRSLPQLSKLHIWECNELRNVVEDDSKDHGLIFPKLEDLDIGRCMNLEFIFPSLYSGGLQKLKYLVVREAPKVKYIFGKYLTNQDESDKVQVDLSALETLSLTKVPNMTSICAKKHNILRLPSLRNIALENCQELSARPFPNLTLYWKPAAAKDLTIVIMDQQKLMSLAVEESIIEEVFNFGVYVDDERFVNSNLEFMRLKYLRELRHICRGGKYGLSLNYLRKLEIDSCRKLRAVFSASMSKSLLQLSDLSLKGCPELLHLIEEDDEENDNDDLHQQLCFPKLEYIDIERCHSLKCLFSISTFRMLPKLQILRIVDASGLEQVFTCKQDDIQKMAVKDVCPTLSKVTLKRLPHLVTVCGRTNFQTVQYVEVVDCPNYEGPQNGDSENEAETEDRPSDQEMPYMGETSASPSFAETTKETLMEIEAKGSVPASEKQAIKALPVDSQLRTPSINDLVDEQTMSEPTGQLQHQDRGKEMKWREHRVIESIRGDKQKEKEVGKAVPALELTGSLKKVVLKLDLDDDKAKNKAMKMVSRFPGVDSITMNMKEKKLTVVGNIDPYVLVSKLRKVWHTEILSVATKEAREKKKDPNEQTAELDPRLYSPTKEAPEKKKDPNEQAAQLATRLYSPNRAGLDRFLRIGL